MTSRVLGQVDDTRTYLIIGRVTDRDRQVSVNGLRSEDGDGDTVFGTEYSKHIHCLMSYLLSPNNSASQA